MKPTDQMSVIDGITGYPQFPEGRGTQCHSGPYERVQRPVRRQRGEGKARTTAFIMVFIGRMGKAR